MSTFSPYTYRVSQFASYQGLSNDNIDAYYNVYTMLAKPIKRNVYKLSLGQLLHYMVDFGIGYNSVCITTVTNLQKFTTGMYVNKHETDSWERPATVADLKEKVFDVVKKIIEVTIKGNNNNPTNKGVKKINTIYPKCIFTLDASTQYADKLKLLTGHTYSEVSFNNFAYSSSSSYTPEYSSGYAPADDFLMVPNHSHDTHENMKKAISYSWSTSWVTKGNTMWQGHANHTKMAQFEGHHWDSAINYLWEPSPFEYVECTASTTPSWETPEVECEDSEKKYPDDTVTISGSKMISLRWPGRRYRLFVRQD